MGVNVLAYYCSQASGGELSRMIINGGTDTSCKSPACQYQPRENCGFSSNVIPS